MTNFMVKQAFHKPSIAAKLAVVSPGATYFAPVWETYSSGGNIGGVGVFHQKNIEGIVFVFALFGILGACAHIGVVERFKKIDLGVVDEINTVFVCRVAIEYILIHNGHYGCFVA